MRQSVEELERRDLLSIGLAVDSAGVLPVPCESAAHSALEEAFAAEIAAPASLATAGAEMSFEK